MWETLFSLLAAGITIFIAKLLVKKQNRHHKDVTELVNDTKEIIQDIAIEVENLTGEEPEECTLTYLENRMILLNDTLSLMRKPTYKRRNKDVKRQKDITDD